MSNCLCVLNALHYPRACVGQVESAEVRDQWVRSLLIAVEEASATRSPFKYDKSE